MKRLLPILLLIVALLPLSALAAPGIPVVTVETNGQGQSYTLTLQMLALMTAITLLPAALLMMTGFTRIIIVLAILRQALGAGQAPPNQVLIGLSLFLTFFVMGPVFDQINADALQPYMDGKI
jgi:flagellar biosynthetic protein FliP